MEERHPQVHCVWAGLRDSVLMPQGESDRLCPTVPVAAGGAQGLEVGRQQLAASDPRPRRRASCEVSWQCVCTPKLTGWQLLRFVLVTVTVSVACHHQHHHRWRGPPHSLPDGDGVLRSEGPRTRSEEGHLAEGEAGAGAEGHLGPARWEWTGEDGEGGQGRWGGQGRGRGGEGGGALLQRTEGQRILKPRPAAERAACDWGHRLRMGDLWCSHGHHRSFWKP